MTTATRRLLIRILPSAFCLLPIPARAAITDADLNADIRILLDPHASSNVKIAAAQRLGDQGPAAGLAIPALVRQTQYNMEPVRNKARESLYKVVGPKEAERLLAIQARADKEAHFAELKEFPDSLTHWTAATELELLLEINTNGSARLALDTLKKLAQTDPKGAEVLTGYHRETLLEGLEHIAHDDPAIHADLLPLIEILGPARAPSVRLLFRCSLDPKITRAPALLEQVHRLLADALDRTPHTPSALQGLADAVADPDPRLAAAAAARVTPAVIADPDFKPSLATAVAAQVAAGRADALALLKRYDVSPDTFAHRVYNLVSATPAARKQNLRLLNAVLPGAAQSTLEARPELRRLLIAYVLTPQEDAQRRSPSPDPVVVKDDEDLAAAAAPLLTGPLARQDLRFAIDQATAEGRAPTIRILRAAKVDPRDICHRLIDPLANGPHPTRLAAARTLASIGVPPDDAPTRAALERALRTLDSPDLRHAAADALDTPRAHDLARLPELLRDLAAPTPSTRQRAARQIQSLGLFEPPVTAALVRATDAGDLVTREGLRLALERSFLDNRPTKDVLVDLAATTPTPDDPTRTYARAALHTIDSQR